MYISLRNLKEFPQDDVQKVIDFLRSPIFTSIIHKDLDSKNDEYARMLHHVGTDLYAVRHTEFPIGSINDIETTLHLSSLERYGHLDFYQLGTESNKSSIIYWIIVSHSDYTLPTHTGLICMEGEDDSKPVMLDRFDHLWIAGNSKSTVFAIDNGSSHPVT